MAKFVHQRHKGPAKLSSPRRLIVACPPMHSKVNLSRIIRALGCFGVTELIAAGNAGFDSKITREAETQIRIRQVRTLAPELRKRRSEGYQLVGLEQTTNSKCLYDFGFERDTILVVGSERAGITEDVLELLDHTVEIPVHGMPFSFNAATATVMAVYEYCRQHRD